MDRCPTCDARYCGITCHADDLRYVYVTGVGFRLWTEAAVFQDRGHRVDWRRSHVPVSAVTT